jgi:hypothetical protein
METEKKVELIVDMLPLLPLIARGVASAAETFNRMYTALKDGVTAEEWASLIAERDAVLDSVIEMTAPSPAPEPAPAA